MPRYSRLYVGDIQETVHPFDVRELLPKDKKQNTTISDEIIQILGNFKDSEDLPSAVELLLMYYKKRPDLFREFYSVFCERFQVDIYSKRLGYRTQLIVVDYLCTAVEQSPNDINMIGLFVQVAGNFLQLDFSTVASGRHHSITISNFALEADQPVLEYRNKLLAHLLSIYQSGTMNTEIAHIINDYGVAHHGTKVSSDIIRAEFEAILRFFTLFQPDDLYACVLANHIKQLSASINYPSIEPLFPFLNSKKYKVFSIIFTIKESKMDAGYISRN